MLVITKFMSFLHNCLNQNSTKRFCKRFLSYFYNVGSIHIWWACTHFADFTFGFGLINLIVTTIGGFGQKYFYLKTSCLLFGKTSKSTWFGLGIYYAHWISMSRMITLLCTFTLDWQARTNLPCQESFNCTVNWTESKKSAYNYYCWLILQWYFILNFVHGFWPLPC